jgi:hypothetical protein
LPSRWMTWLLGALLLIGPQFLFFFFSVVSAHLNYSNAVIGERRTEGTASATALPRAAGNMSRVHPTYCFTSRPSRVVSTHRWSMACVACAHFKFCCIAIIKSGHHETKITDYRRGRNVACTTSSLRSELSHCKKDLGILP